MKITRETTTMIMELFKMKCNKEELAEIIQISVMGSNRVMDC